MPAVGVGSVQSDPVQSREGKENLRVITQRPRRDQEGRRRSGIRSGWPDPPSPHSNDAVELLLEWCPERLLPLPEEDEDEDDEDDEMWWWREPLRDFLDSSAGRPCTMPLRASMPPLTENWRQTMKARMAAFSWASGPDS
jgi:hypothetical protein